MKTENETFGLSASTPNRPPFSLNISPTPPIPRCRRETPLGSEQGVPSPLISPLFPLPPLPPGKPHLDQSRVRSVTLIAGAEACSPGPSPTLRAAAFTDRTRAACQPLCSVTALQDLYAVDGIETSLWTPKFINN